MMRATRASSSLLARISNRGLQVPRRSFAASTAIKYPDVVQDLYLKGLREYKAPAEKPTDAEGHVQKFSPPSAPQSPEESNLASDMQTYESQAVEIEGQASSTETAQHEEDYFEDLQHLDEEPAHH